MRFAFCFMPYFCQMFLLDIAQTLQRWDQALFNFINNDLSNPVFDAMMPVLRISYIWAPLYIFIIVFVSLNYKVKGLWWIVFFLLVVASADMIGTRVFKHNIERVRPCNLPHLFPNIKLLVVCPSGYGFTSNHAANHFGMATFIFLSFRHIFKRWAWIVFLWAGAICFAQVYVGVHYPGDILGGAALGITFAVFYSYLFRKNFGQLPAT
jgi:membrane-associated phospholipid phosphatase